MKLLKSISLIFSAFLVAVVIFGVEKALPFLLICLALNVLINAKTDYNNQYKKLAFTGVIVGVSLGVCAFLFITNII